MSITVSSVRKEDADNRQSRTEIHRHPRIVFSLWGEAAVAHFHGSCVFVAVDCFWCWVWTTSTSKNTARESWTIECHVDVKTSVHYNRCNHCLTGHKNLLFMSRRTNCYKGWLPRWGMTKIVVYNLTFNTENECTSVPPWLAIIFTYTVRLQQFLAKKLLRT